MRKKTIIVLILLFILSFHSLIPSIVYAEYTSDRVRVDDADEYANFCAIKDGEAVLYTYSGSKKKNITICVNAGHGTRGGSSVFVQSHPDGTGKVTSGSTEIGSTTATAVSDGMEFDDETPEAEATLQVALKLRDILLEDGYDVLMTRETEDVQLDNIARTILANKYANFQVSLHFDDSPGISGAYYTKIPINESYRSMEPVNSNWEKCDELGKNMIEGLRQQGGIAINGEEGIEMDLVQISYARVPTMVIEMGNGHLSLNDALYQNLAEGVYKGIKIFIENNPNLKNGSKDKTTSKKNKKDKKGLLDSFYQAILEKVGDLIDFIKFLFGDIPQMVVDLIATIPNGTWKDFKITYKYDTLNEDGENGNKNKYTIVSEELQGRTYSLSIDGEEEEFSRDTEIPVIPVDLYHFSFGKIKQFDANILVNKESRTPIVNFIANIIHVIIYLMSAFLITMLIWHGVSIVLKTITPIEMVKHKEGLKNFFKATLLLVSSIIIMGLCIYMTKLIIPNLQTNHKQELPIRVNVGGDANYSFSTNIIGYLRYMSDLKNTEMIMQKLVFSFFYVLLAIGNCILVLVMLARFMVLMYLSAIGPIVAVQSSINSDDVKKEENTSANYKISKMTFIQWIQKYIFWSSLQLMIAIPYRIILEMCFKQ